MNTHVTRTHSGEPHARARVGGRYARETDGERKIENEKAGEKGQRERGRER